MKKILVASISLFLLLSSCQKEDGELNFIGKWEVSNAIEFNGSWGPLEFDFEIYEDGSAKRISSNYEHDYIWMLDEGGTVIYLIKDEETADLGNELKAFKFEILKNYKNAQFWREEFMALAIDGNMYPHISEWTMTRQ